MKNVALLILLLCATVLPAQRTTKVTVQAEGCQSAIQLFAFNGVGFDLIGSLDAQDDGSFTTDVETEEEMFYYFGSSPNDAIPVIVGADDALTIKAKCGQFRNAIVMDSPVNMSYRRLKQKFQSQSTDYQVSARAIAQASKQNNEAVIRQESAAMKRLDGEKKALLEEMRTESPILGRVAAMNTFMSYVNNNNGRYENELEYLVNTYFDFVDFEDPGYNHLTWTYEGNRNLANILSSAVKGTELNEILLQTYDRWPEGSQAQFLAMSGGFAALQQRKHPGALGLAEATIERFEAKFPAPVAQLESQIAQLRTFSIGAEAPTFAGTTPEGETLDLKELRGNVVLIDFWASWCGPCRRENPNVVKVYEKYKDQGFEILGVSLDKTKDRWVKAIAADKLTWKHVSDLKGWRSAYSRLYGVNSIPATVLLDREGRILARNLRGPALEQKLAEVFSAK